MVKLDDGKLPYYTVLFKQFPNAIREVIKCSQAGHIKYAESDPDWMNFKTVEPARYLEALLRHLTQKDSIDTELEALTGIPVNHTAQVAWNALAYLEIQLSMSYTTKFQQVVAALSVTNSHFTKEQVKNSLKSEGFTNEEFDSNWNSLNPVETGARTKDNKKYYSIKPTHFSQTRKVSVQVKDMHPKHILNTIKRDYDVEDIFTKDTEAYQLAKRYFFNIFKEEISRIISNE